MTYQLLSIVIGVPKAVQDTNTAETDVDGFSLVSDGFSVNPINTWKPQIAALKGGGVYDDSATRDGQSLRLSALGNVQESIQIVGAAATHHALQELLTKFYRFIDLAQDFATSFSQIRPVYLEWKPLGTDLSQYALIDDISVSVNNSGIDQQNIPFSDLTLSITRHPLWSTLPPGSNPILWTFERAGLQPGKNYTFANMSLIAGTNHLVYDTAMRNKSEWQPTGATAYVATITKNFIDIPAALVPGDAPAPFCVHINTTQPGGIGYLWMGRSSKEMQLRDSNGVTRAESYVFNAGDAFGAVFSKTIVTAAEGPLSNGSAVNPYVVDMAFAAGAPQPDYFSVGMVNMYWPGNKARLSIHMLRGRFAVFVRGGANTSSEVYGRVFFGGDPSISTSGGILLPEFRLNNSYVDILHYVGDLVIPVAGRGVYDVAGRGIGVYGNIEANLYLQLRNALTTAASARISDLVLIPYDEGSAFVNVGYGTTDLLIDNTGYLNRGENKPIALAGNGATPSTFKPVEIAARDLVLLPNTAQRLHFLTTGSGSFSDFFAFSRTYTVRLNIIPQWKGRRSE